MKSILLISLIFLFCFASCKEDMNDNLETEIIEVSLTGTESYEYKIAAGIPTEGGYEIRKQAKNYQVSKMNWGKYAYQAKEGFTGTETVEIVLSTSIGDRNFSDQKRWIFEIKVK